MSMNTKRFIEYDRYELDKKGRKIHIWRQHTVNLTKAEVAKARENKEKMNPTQKFKL